MSLHRLSHFLFLYARWGDSGMVGQGHSSLPVFSVMVHSAAVYHYDCRIVYCVQRDCYCRECQCRYEREHGDLLLG